MPEVFQTDPATIESVPEYRLILRQKCSECGDEIMMQIFLNTGVCCELCRKVKDGEISAFEWVALKGM